jgi:hypothetical protein
MEKENYKMKQIVLIITVAFIAGLFTVGQALGAGQTQWGSEGTQMEKQSGVVSESERMAALQLNQEQVRELQTILNEKGHDAGVVDGIIGPRTSNAISEFQKSEGLATTGKADEKTLRALAPSAEQHDFFGLSPEFGEKEERQMEKQPMEQMEQQQQQKQAPEGSRY